MNFGERLRQKNLKRQASVVIHVYDHEMNGLKLLANMSR